MNCDIAITTWPNHPKRLEYFEKCIKALKTNLQPQHKLRYYCSSESQSDPEHAWLGPDLEELCREHGVTLRFRDREPDLGANMNTALRMTTAPFILLIQDDFELTEPVNIEDGCWFLAKNLDFSLLRYMCSGTRFEPLEVNGYRVVDAKGPWSYGDNPHLRRRDFMAQYGWYREGLRHSQVEREMRERLQRMDAKIAATPHNVFRHIGAVTSVVDDNRKRKDVR